MEGTRESHPRVHDLPHPRLGKPRRGLQIMDTRMGFPCPFHRVVIDSIIPAMFACCFDSTKSLRDLFQTKESQKMLNISIILDYSRKFLKTEICNKKVID